MRFFSNGDRKYDARLYELVIDKGKHNANVLLYFLFIYLYLFIFS